MKKNIKTASIYFNALYNSTSLFYFGTFFHFFFVDKEKCIFLCDYILLSLFSDSRIRQFVFWYLSIKNKILKIMIEWIFVCFCLFIYESIKTKLPIIVWPNKRRSLYDILLIKNTQMLQNNPSNIIRYEYLLSIPHEFTFCLYAAHSIIQ